MTRSTGLGFIFFLALVTFLCGASPAVSRAEPAHTTSICIEYFGEQASALLPTVISDSVEAAKRGEEDAFEDTKLFRPDSYTTDHRNLVLLVLQIRAIHEHNIELKRPYVVFHIIIIQGGRKETKILDGNQTFGLLERFKSVCGQGSLFDRLVYVQRVIDLYEGKNHAS